MFSFKLRFSITKSSHDKFVHFLDPSQILNQANSSIFLLKCGSQQHQHCIWVGITAENTVRHK